MAKLEFKFQLFDSGILIHYSASLGFFPYNLLLYWHPSWIKQLNTCCHLNFFNHELKWICSQNVIFCSKLFKNHSKVLPFYTYISTQMTLPCYSILYHIMKNNLLESVITKTNKMIYANKLPLEESWGSFSFADFV